jgi:hypothetical protein
LVAVGATVSVPANGAPIAYDPFDYAAGVSLSSGVGSAGSGWSAAWETAVAGVPGLLTNDPIRSLAFGQAPPDGLIGDGGNHIFSDTNRGSRRDFSTAVDLAGQTLFMTALVRASSGADQVDLRAEFFDGAGATGNMRANVGISDGLLYAHGGGSGSAGLGYLPSGAASAGGLFADETTYLLAMKRTSSAISAALIPADGNLDTMTSEPVWQVVHNQPSGVDLTSLRLIANGTDGGIRLDELRIASDWEGSVAGLAVPEPSRTFVFKVDQPTSSVAQAWTHVVAEPGDYQIGCAWVETQTGGAVAIEVFHNSMRVKALYAPAGEVTRLETRLEDLAAGDEVTVKAIPDGATYRLGYEIAFVTPTFAGLPVFPVSEHGAVGDGVTDDMAAIQATVEAAKQAGGGIVSLDGTKTYRAIGLNTLTEEFLFDLDWARDIKIEGNGAKILLHPPDGLASVRDAENVQIDGLTVDFLPKPYYQGTINQIDVAGRTIDITVPDRYPVPQTGPAPDHAPLFGRSFIPDAPGARSGRGENIYIESIEQNGGDRELRIRVPELANGAPMTPRLQEAFDDGATEFVVPHLTYGHLGGRSFIMHSARVTFSNIHQICAPYFWIMITHNVGPLTLSNVDLKTDHPETELLASWRDGMHIKNGRWGILIEDGDWDGGAMYDDTFALYSRTQVLVSTAGNVATLTPSFEGRETFLWQPGDWASIWSPDQEVFRGMARVVGAVDVAAPNYEVTFESLPAGILPDDIVIHEESLNRGTVVRNCRNSIIGTEDASTRFRGTDVLFQDNHFEDFGFRLEYNPSLGSPRARDVIIEDCYIRSFPQEGCRVILTRASGVTFRGGTIDATEVYGHFGTDDIQIDSVALENMTGDSLNLINESNASLFGSSSRNGSTDVQSSGIEVDGTSQVSFVAPGGYPPAVPPSNGEDIEAPDTPTGLVATSRAAQAWLDWNRCPTPDIHSYKVYRADTPGGSRTLVADGLVVSRWIDGGLTNGTSYHYVVTALDNSGNESLPSEEVAVIAGPPQDMVFEDFAYPDTTVLEGGIARGGFGWFDGWQADGAGGLVVSDGRLSGSGSATREIQNTFVLNPPDIWLSFLARSDDDGSFDLDLKQTDGNLSRWSLSRNPDGSVTIRAGTITATSAPDLFSADTDYLVLSRFDTASDTASFKLIETLAPGDLTAEPTQWDLSADGLSGVEIDRIDIHITGGEVSIDDLRIGRTFGGVAVLPPGYSAWASPRGVTGAPEDDDDGDGVANLMEFALGGEPTDAGFSGYSPFASQFDEDGIEWFAYTYPMRSGSEAGLLYSARVSETLAPGSWTEEGVVMAGRVRDGFGTGFDAVTVRVAMEGKSRLFIRLVVALL